MNTVFTLTSAIHVPNTPLDYSKVRSVFDSKTRMEHTLEAISSIRKHSPSSKIFVYECSDLVQEERSELERVVDRLIMINEIPLVKQHRYNANKSAAEATQLIEIYRDSLVKEFDFAYKSAGRYSITEKFDPWYIKPENKAKVIVRKRFTNGSRYWFGTQLFCVGKFMIPMMELQADRALGLLVNTQGGLDIESTLFRGLIDSQLIEVENIGSRGMISVNGEVHEH